METRDRTDDRGRTSLVGTVLVAGAAIAVVVTATLAVRTLDTADASATPSTTLPSTTIPTTTSAPTTTTTTTTTTPTTTVPVTTTTTAPPRPPSLNRGSEGSEVEALQHRLVALGFYVPVVDGHYGALTQQAVMAFQKSVGIGRDGVAGPATLGALETAEPVRAREGGDHIEVDLERQIMILVRGEATYVFNTSSGRSGWRTPPGRFTITREIDGVRHAPLGDLYRPKYFNGGIALHGSPSIPGQPASHGCTRLHNAVVDHIWSADLAPIGTPVWVY
ncbi:L,D-transpeptidase family protein [Actinospongicola halichondriae]|uniref:L,D-transpeptidase family protein n=1 Tax=Actinospongicola halichondriae TaxID=3236844 RepID=UPI003D4D2E15